MEYHEPTPSVLLLHDGELAPFAEVIGTLGGVERRGNPNELDRARAWDVIIASASRMLELHEHLSDSTAVRIAVLDGDSKTLRKMLKQIDTDLMVRQPVHPAALRLLILHALYRGPEKRRTTRVSMGAPVRFRSGLRRRPAILAELSTRGCRMMVDAGSHRVAPDRLVTIALPPEVTNDNRSLSLRGHVMRISDGEADNDVIAVLFERLRDSTRKRLESIVSAHSQGPAVLDDAVAHALTSLPIISEGADSQPTSPQSAAPLPSAPEGSEPQPAAAESAVPPSSTCESQPDEATSERRAQERHALSRRIVALGDEAARVLIGRDLSVGGMRIDPTPGLSKGDRLKIAVHVRPDGQPLEVSAEITRDDGPGGMALRFVDLCPETSTYLEEMIFALPTIIESDNSKEGSGVVVSEVVGRRAS
jgi:hypothetical protein